MINFISYKGPIDIVYDRVMIKPVTCTGKYKKAIIDFTTKTK